MKNNDAKLRMVPSPKSDSALELANFLLSLPPAPKRSGGFGKGDLQIHITGGLELKLRILSKSVNQMTTTIFGNEVAASPTHSFRAETLVCYLLTSFLTDQRKAVDSLLAHLKASESQHKIDELARIDAAINSLLD